MSISELFIQFVERTKGITISSKSSSDFIYFDINNLHYCFQTMGVDPNFFRILLRLDVRVTESNSAEIYKKCVELSTNVKCGKAIIIGESVWLSVEQLYYSSDDCLDLLFQRMLSILSFFYQSYINENIDGK